MSDDDFFIQFEACTLPKEYFKHYGHVRIAWLYLMRYPFDEAINRMANGLKKYAASLGASHIYHETLTRAWVYLVNKNLSKVNEPFSDFIARNPHLLDKMLPSQYYSFPLLDDTLSRQEWVEPDLKSFKD